MDVCSGETGGEEEYEYVWQEMLVWFSCLEDVIITASLVYRKSGSSGKLECQLRK